MGGARRQEVVPTGQLKKILERWIREHEAYFPQVPKNPQCPDDAQDFRYSARNWLEEHSGVQTRRIHDIMHGRFEFTPLERADALLVAMDQQCCFHTGELDVQWAVGLGEKMESQGTARQEAHARVQEVLRRCRLGHDRKDISYELGVSDNQIRRACRHYGVPIPKSTYDKKENHRKFSMSVFGSDQGRPKGIDDPVRYKKIAEYQMTHGTSKAAQVFDLDRSTIRRIVRKVKAYELV
jgi:hypothetical protein